MNLATVALLLLAAGPADDNRAADMETVSTTSAPAPLHEHPTLLSMLRRNNELRGSVGLRPQRINAVLTRAAQNHAWYMARSGSFSHYSNYGPEGRARRFGFGGNVRENIAMGHRNVGTTFVGWRNSGAHWSSIVCDAPEVGFGYALSPNGTPYWVAVYGYPTADDKKSEFKTAELRTEKQDTSHAQLPAAVKEKQPQPAASTATATGTQPVYNNYGRRGLMRFFRR